MIPAKALLAVFGDEREQKILVNPTCSYLKASDAGGAAVRGASSTTKTGCVLSLQKS
jgi:hypothetical protein